jgi:predicted xylose isomerase-like sugar epimerase
MRATKNQKIQKDMLLRHIRALKRFNEWEDNRVDRMEGDRCLAAISALYRLIPEDARGRAVDVEGIVKMRRALACLK